MKNDEEAAPGERLRQRAEEQLARREPTSTGQSGMTGDRKVIHELEVHQIELELQNEELITARQTADELRQEYQTLFDIAPVGYLVLGPRSTILRCNRRAAELFGTPADHLTGRRLAVFLDPATLAAFNTFYQDCCLNETGRPSEFVTCLAPPSQSAPRDLHFFGKSIPSAHHQSECIVAISDITELHQHQEALGEINRKLHLLSNITRHDVLNQVMILTSSLELIRMKMKEGGPIDEDLARCESSVEAVSRLIEFTRGYERFGVGKPMWQSPGTIAETFRKKTALAVTVDPSLHAIEVYADMMLPSVFSNIFLNAEQHGGDNSRIAVSFHPNGRKGILVIEDDGIGIPDDMKEEIFRRDVGEGTGLGLFFCSEILGITGISFCETGIFGEGARFELHIPARVWKYRNDALIS
ncbi:MAG TPA: PAS domain-containing protein [Methanoculleus sp.]|nr:PAS domain-containing protein [Methanoculleus sp.]